MFDQIEALRALADTGTTARAAARLRLTQSAVSKRIAALEGVTGTPLVEKRGRGLVLTAAGLALLADVEPHLAAVRARLGTLVVGPTTLRLAATESLLAAWLPAALRKAQAATSVELDLHAHRGPLVVERVQSGRADLGICVSGDEGNLVSAPLVDEPMVLVGAQAWDTKAPLEVWTIEARSLTGAWLQRRLSRIAWPIVPKGRIESFGSAVQLARAGFGPALVPLGVAAAMGLGSEARRVVPGLDRPIVAICTPTTASQPGIAAFAAALAVACGTAVDELSPGWRNP